MLFKHTLLDIGARTVQITNKSEHTLQNYHYSFSFASNGNSLGFYCEDDTIDAIPLAFLFIFFGKGGQPVIDFANVRDDSHFRRVLLNFCISPPFRFVARVGETSREQI